MAHTIDRESAPSASRSSEADGGTPALADASIVDVPGERASAYQPSHGNAPVESRGSGRWWVGVVAASIVALPLGWILSFAAALPFMIGTFFFAILGLIIGAVAFRVSLANRPYSRRTVLLGTTVIVLVGWGFALHTEATDLPRVMGKIAQKNTRDLGGMDADAFEVAVAESVRGYLATRYPPGGTLGYIRWVVAEGSIPSDQIPRARTPLTVQQTGWVWIIRVAMSLGLLGFGIASQTLPLTTTAKADSPRDG